VLQLKPDPLEGTAIGDVTPSTSQATAAPFIGPWIFLFPATYLVHIAEEYWGGFPTRTAELTGLAIPEAAFLAANVFFWILMLAAVMATLYQPSRAPLVITLATVITVNATLHVGGALLTASYSPGLVSGLLLWLPLGVSALVRGFRAVPERGFRHGVLVGVLVHVLVPLVGLGFVVALGGGWREA